mmetsp:Transcript_16790/g.48771  ORF Transcript_16790/g.48771 Transcript_16790/m.48771 type:complete len:208 (+) Transcript_16790:1440-2063(+)
MAAEPYRCNIVIARSGSPTSKAALIKHEYMTLSAGICLANTVCKDKHAEKCFLLDSIFIVVCQNRVLGLMPCCFMARTIRSTTSIFPTRTADCTKEEYTSSEKPKSRPSRSSDRYKLSARVNSRKSRCRSIRFSSACTCALSAARLSAGVAPPRRRPPPPNEGRAARRSTQEPSDFRGAQKAPAMSAVFAARRAAERERRLSCRQKR